MTVTFLYRDACNYKTSFDHEIDLFEFPNAGNLAVGDEIEMSQLGTLSQADFFGSEIHTYSYNDEYDHNLLEVVEILQ